MKGWEQRGGERRVMLWCLLAEQVSIHESKYLGEGVST